MKKKMIIILSSILIVALLVATCLVGFNVFDDNSTKDIPNVENNVNDDVVANPINDDIVANPINDDVVAYGDSTFEMEQGKSYSMPENIVFMANGEATAVTLEATVLPVEAVNKLVDWCVFWGDEESTFASGKNVTNYIMVTPAEDGSNFACVQCLMGFEDETIIIEVSTRDGGYKAFCSITFIGIPSSLTINVGDLTSTTQGEYEIYQLGNNEIFTFDLDLDNDYGCVGDGYSSYTVSYSAMGNYRKGTYFTPQYTWQDESIVYLEDNKSEFGGAVIWDHQLCITTRDIVENYYSSYVNDHGNGTYYNKFKEWTTSDGIGCDYYFEAKVTNIASGLTQTFRYQIYSSVQNCSLSSTVLEF